MRFGVLGPLSVEIEGQERPIAGNRDRSVLVMLLLHANQMVSVDQLVDAVWAEIPPRTARAQIHSCVSRLRATLGEVIQYRSGGYLINVEHDELDLVLFRDTVEQARRAASQQRLAEADDLYTSALAFWRGPALAAVTGSVLAAAGTDLEERRMAAVEEHLAVQLALGREERLVGELVALVNQYPLRERLRGHLMLALYRTGRQADALTVYRQGRQHLAEELGIEPGEDLAELHHRILNRDPDLLANRKPSPGATIQPMPNTLPRDVADFTGREAVVARLREMVGDAVSSEATAPLIVAIDGMAGVGKTALAIRVAHLVAPCFPDARLYLDLHGHSENSPVEPPVVLDRLLRQLGIRGDQIPQQMEDRVALWRSELARRRTLLVLDNVADSEQITQLLPTTAGCIALITSRRRLFQLDGAHIVSLDVLSNDEAVTLLERVVGERIRAARHEAMELGTLCGNLALALRLAAAKLVHRPKWQITDLTAILNGPDSLPAALTGEGRTLASAFALSYKHLSESAQRQFRLLGLHPGPDIDTAAAAALSGETHQATQRVMDELLDSHLVEEPVASRYRLHDLLKSYAYEMARIHDAEELRDESLQRLIEFYKHATVSATRRFTLTQQVLDDVTGSNEQPVVFSDANSARSWLDVEYANVLALVRHSYARQWHKATYELTRAIWSYQYERAYQDDCLETHDLAQRAARDVGDLGSAAHVIINRASVHHFQGRWHAALADLREAGELARQSGRRGALARALLNSGKILRRLGQLDEARSTALEAAVVFEELGDLQGALVGQLDAALVDIMMGETQRAIEIGRANLRIGRHLGDYHFALVLAHLGRAEILAGRPHVARRVLKRAISLSRPIAKIVAVEAAIELAVACRQQQDFEEALDVVGWCLDTAQRFGDEALESEVRTVLGDTLIARGDFNGALDQYRQALALVANTPARLERARALNGLADALDPNDAASARECRRQALILYEELGLPEKDAIRAKLQASGAVDPLLGTVSEDLPLPHR